MLKYRFIFVLIFLSASSFGLIDPVAAAEFSRSRVGPVSGVVYDENFSPIMGAEVIIAPLYREDPRETVVSDREGKFRLENFPYGITVITVKKSGFDLYEDTRMLSANSYNLILPLVSSEFDPLSVYHPGRQVIFSGRVFDQDNQIPVAGATVIIGETYQLTDANGRFNLAGVESGRALINILKEGYYQFSEEILVTPGRGKTGKSDRHDFAIQRQYGKGNIYGLIRIRIHAGPTPPLKVLFGNQVVFTDSRGMFQISEIDEGDYPVHVIYDGYEVYSDFVRVNAGDQSYQIIIEELPVRGR